MISRIQRKPFVVQSLGALFVGLMLFFSTRHASAQVTTIYYQGRLTDGSNAAAGTYDLRFSLFDAPTNGAMLAGPITNSGVAISNGLFQVALDFGTNAFNGADRWAEIQVRTNGAFSFSILSPREKIGSVPYAITAANLTGPVTFTNPGNVYVGNGAGLTNIPASGVAGLKPMAFQDTNGPQFNSAVNYGGFMIATNAQFPYGGISLNASQTAIMFWNELHPGGGEFQFTSVGSLSINSGYDGQHRSLLQLGSSATGFQGYAENINIQYDSVTDATHPLGYSHLFQFVDHYFSSNGDQFGYLGMRSQAVDTNGHSELRFYNPTSGNNVLYGQTPGTEVFAVTPSGTRTTGTSVRSLIQATATNIYALDFNKADKIELTMSANLRLSVTNLLLSGATAEKDIYLIPGAFARGLSLPANWVWESDSGTATTPTVVPAGTAMHIHVTVNGGSAGTNIYARYTLAPYAPGH